MSVLWDSYLTRIDDNLALVVADIGEIDFAPNPDRPVLIEFSVRLNSPDEIGGPGEEEEQELDDFEQVLIGAMKRRLDATFVGRVTLRGALDFYFYAPPCDDFPTVLKGPEFHAPGHEWKFAVEDDPGWTTYKDYLFPSSIDFQWMQDREQVEALREEGDLLHSERAVTHTLRFPEREGRDKCRETLQPHGFEFRELTHASEDGLSWVLEVSNWSAVELPVINNASRQLFLLAEELGGDYAGWTCDRVTG